VDRLTDAGAGSDLAGDLRYCVTNAISGNDTITFGVTGTIDLKSALPTLNKGVAIQGPGANLLMVERDPASSTSFGIFAIGSAASVQITGLTLAKGTEGAITNAGTLTVSSCTLTGNSAYGQYGGAIASGGTLTVSNSTLVGNTVYGPYLYFPDFGGFAYGGGIYVSGGTLTLSSSTVSGNTVLGGSYFYANPDCPGYPNCGERIGQDANGGGVYVAGGTVSIDHSTIAGNQAYGGAGDFWNGNGNGGGIYNAAGQGALQVFDTILAGNTANSGTDLSGSFASLGHNLVGNSFGASGFAASDRLNVDPRLGPLQNNGGPTPTMALLPGSPAINAGDNTGAPAFDQRGPGFPRIFGGTIDVGAFETQAQLPPAIVISDVSLPEGNVGTTAALFTVQLSAPGTETVTVKYSTADGGATVSDNDYQAAGGTLTFTPGQTSKTITVLINGDRRLEPNETFYVNLGEATNAVIADGQAAGTIIDEEPTLFIYTEPVAKPEGNSGTTPFTFTVRLSVAYDVPVTVDFATAAGSATAGGDYQTASGKLTFAPGETARPVPVLVNGDRAAEPAESFFVNLSGATNATITASQGTGLILDDESRISINDVTRAEGRKGRTTQFTFSVTLSAAYDQPVTMSYGTANGTATTGDNDYMAKSGTLTFAPGETVKTITIEVKGDGRREADETFFLDLFGLGGNALFTDSRGTGTILNDD
jgi:hypothetical protein